MARSLSSITVAAVAALLASFFGTDIFTTGGSGNQTGLTVLDHVRNEAAFASLATAALVPGSGPLEMVLMAVENLATLPPQ
jgi:hypothetical protein